MDHFKLSSLEEELDFPFIRNTDFGSGMLRRGFHNSDTPSLDCWRQGAEPADSRESIFVNSDVSNFSGVILGL